MSHSWKSLIKDMDLAENETEPPPNQPGQWSQVFSSFLSRGFGRVLALDTPAKLAIHAGHPELHAEAWSSLVIRLESHSGATWESTEAESNWWLVSDDIDAEAKERELATALGLAEALARGEFSLEWMEPPERDLDTSSKADLGVPESSERKSHATLTEPLTKERSGRSRGAFEAIGEGSEATDSKAGQSPRSARETSFVLNKQANFVTVTLTLDQAISTEERAALVSAVSRNLEAKFDVEVHEHSRVLDDLRQICLKAIPADILGDGAPKLDPVHDQLEDYFATVVGLARVGVDPLVFLGARAATEPSSSVALSAPTEEFEAETSSDEAEDTGFVLSLSSPDEDDDEDSVVFESLYPDDGPLKTGRFDDPRLEEPDSDSTLVDVVLRHPGYSNRRVGQVLSILLSIEYHQALRLMGNSPTILARGVGITRGRELQTLVDRAGGRVKLTDPGRFPPSD